MRLNKTKNRTIGIYDIKNEHLRGHGFTDRVETTHDYFKEYTVFIQFVFLNDSELI